MGRSVSSTMLKDGREEFAFQTNTLILEMLNKEQYKAKEGVPHISVKESLISKTTSKARILAHEKRFASAFKKYAGQKADTAKIFDRVIGRTSKVEESITL